MLPRGTSHGLKCLGHLPVFINPGLLEDKAGLLVDKAGLLENTPRVIFITPKVILVTPKETHGVR